MQKQKANSLENITWSELGKQSIQAKKVYYNHKYEDEHVVSSGPLKSVRCFWNSPPQMLNND